MRDFKAKMYQIRFRSLQRSPDPLAGFGRRFAAGGGAVIIKWLGKRRGKWRGRGWRGKWRGGKGRAPKLLLNQGPSEICYATVSLLLKY